VGKTTVVYVVSFRYYMPNLLKLANVSRSYFLKIVTFRETRRMLI